MIQQIFISIPSGFLLLLIVFVAGINPEWITVLDEDFETDKLTDDSVWSGDLGHFIIHTDPEGNNLLRLNAESAGRSHLKAVSEASFGMWEFYIRQDFTPSGSNHAYIFLMSDREDLTGNVNGYALRTGESGSPKRFRLFRFDEGSPTEIAVGSTEISDGGYRIRITRNRNSIWQLFISEGYHSEPKSDIEPVKDDIYHSSSYFGILANYTSTRSDRFYFDDFLIQADFMPFAIKEVSRETSASLKIQFNRSPDPSSILPGNFILESHSSPFSAKLNDAGHVTLQFEKPLASGPQNLTASGVRDYYGFEISADQPFYFFIYDTPQQNDVVINEFMVRPPPEAPKFVELFNQSDKYFNIENWSLKRRDGAPSPGGVFSNKQLTLGPEDYLVITSDSLALAEYFGSGPYISMENFPGFTSTIPDEIRLFTADDLPADSLRYDPESWSNNETGISFERRDPKSISSDPANWASSLNPQGGTPGKINSVYEPDMTPPSLLFANFTAPDTIHIWFNKFVKPDTETRFYLNGRPADFHRHDPKFGQTVSLDASSIASDSEIILTVEKIRDYPGNLAENLQIPVAQPLKKNDLIFNEVMYEPLRDNYDGHPNQSEYLELFNRQSYAISLEGIYLHDLPDEDGKVRVIEPVSTDQRWIPANSYVLIYADPEPSFSEGGNTQFFSLPESLEPFVLRVDRSTLSLPLSGREVFLADSLGTVIDMIHYNPVWHNPNLPDTRGISLERILPYGSTNDPGNWSSSAHPAGGTPGMKNSLFQSPQAQTQAYGISLEPNPFSPDSDGFEDNLMIHYRLNHPDYLKRVRIFDRYGRKVRTLAESTPAGFEGTLVWDGFTDDRQRNRIGIYIILFEAYNSAEGRNQTFRETVVLAKKF